jgi:predicted SAM-dependent methyltransferase
MTTITTIKLNIGCGNSKIVEDFLGLDVRSTPITEYVMPAHDLSLFEDESVDAIYSRHTLEHLTQGDGRTALKEWYRVLKTGGTVQIIVPDLIYHTRQLLVAYKNNDVKNLEHAMAGFYGWQDISRGGSAEDSHKWGYTEKSLLTLIKTSGFCKALRLNERNYTNYKNVVYKRGDLSRPFHLNVWGIK